MANTSLDKSKIKFLLLEGVHQTAVDTLKAAGYTNIEYHTGSLPEEQLKESIADAHFVGIRSRTQLTEEVFQAAEKLIGVGCFCIGTNQVDLKAALKRGIPVFNAPYSNTRSVAELVIAHTVNLMRGIPEKMQSVRKVKYTATLLDLMQGYARIRTKDEFRPFILDRDRVFTMEQALERLRGMIGFAGTWTDIVSYLPDGWGDDPVMRRSATAATFAASLELVKEGKAQIKQEEMFAPIMVRRAERKSES